MKFASICLFLIACTASAESISDMVKRSPEEVMNTMTKGAYSDILALVRNAYAESKGVDGETALYVYVLALDQAPSDKKIQLALDFSLAQSDMTVKQFGARAISTAVLKGVAVEQSQRQQAISSLKDGLRQSVAQNRDVFGFAVQAANALMLLGDDAGLDVFLTDAQGASNYAKKDGWNITSDATRFEQLKTQYEQQAIKAENVNPDVDRIMAAAYELCRVRRIQNKEIKALTPLVNLDNLLNP